MNTPDHEYHYQRYTDPKTCFIPTCSKSDKKNPGLKFFAVRNELKENWCQLAGRNCPKRQIYCCEYHINFEEDLENYNKWIAGARPRLKLNAKLKNYLKKREENVGDLTQAQASTSSSVAEEQIIHTVHAGTQCRRMKMPNKSTMAKPETSDKSTNFRARKLNKAMPLLITNSTDGEGSPRQAPSVPRQAPSVFGSSNFDSATSSDAKNEDDKCGREHLLKNIISKPKMYLGLPKNFWWTVNHIAQKTSSVALHIIITLFKLKTNDSFARMSDEFEMARLQSD